MHAIRRGAARTIGIGLRLPVGLQRAFLLPLLLWVLCHWPSHAQAPVQVPVQATQQVTSQAPTQAPMLAAKLLPGERIVLDGSLSHPAWQRAPAHGAFSTNQPLPGLPLPQRTQVQWLFDADALYVGITAFDDQPAAIRQPLVRSDQVNRTQDFVVVYIDAIGTGRSAQFFRVNAAGSLGDGLHTAADDSEDFSPDFDWDAAVAHNAQGWTAVLRLPLASLRFDSSRNDWRVMVARRLPREQFYLLTSVPVTREMPSFIHAMQPLQGLELPAHASFLSLRPGLTLRHERTQPGSRNTEAHASLDLKWRPVPEVVIDATLYPDFSQVALDVPQLAGNSRFALSFPEKRPFFFESADLLRSPTEAFYTRSFTEPRWGLRGTWRSNDWAGTALALEDRGGGLVLLPGPFNTDATAQPASTVLAARVRSDASQMQWGALLASRRYASGLGENTVLGPDLAWQISDSLRLRAQWLHSRSTALPGPQGLQIGPALQGQRMYLRAYHQTHDSEVNFGVDDLDPGFRHDSGFVNQVGVRKWHGWLSKGWFKVGPFNQFWVNAEWDRVTDRRSGERVSESLRPGIWATAANNLEWWAELYAHTMLRTRAGGPLLRERFVSTGLVFTPARWFPLFDGKLELGQLADTVAEQVRPGAKLRLDAKLRPLPQLELQPSISAAWLQRNGQRTYSESAAQWLVVWHFNASHNLRLIVERSTLDRQAEMASDGQSLVPAQRYRSSTLSLTYGWRESAGTVLYVGASQARQHESGLAVPRTTEVFVKLQFDLDEARHWLHRPPAPLAPVSPLARHQPRLRL